VVIADDLNDVSALEYVLFSVREFDRPEIGINASHIIEEIRIDVHRGDQRAISSKIAFQSGGGRGGLGRHIYPARN
jgi:hypothetical protein